MRGLKLLRPAEPINAQESHAVCVRGLKLRSVCLYVTDNMSHAVCVRGLKPFEYESAGNPTASHAVCVRGLKHIIKLKVKLEKKVARRVRAWIETNYLRQQIQLV